MQKNIWWKNLLWGIGGGLIGGSLVFTFAAKTFSSRPNVTNTQQNITLSEDSAIIDAVTKIKPSVVSIVSSSEVQNIFGGTFEQKSSGTGFIIRENGIIVTNRHVVSDDNAAYKVVTSEGKTYDAEIKARDSFNDLAIIKINESKLPVADLGDSDALQVGQKVIAVGNALGEYQNTVTFGVISAVGRTITAGNGAGSSETLEGVIQTDAAINPGNSGGPLVNMAGQVIGINTAIDTQGSQIGFAIPINSVKSAIDSVLTTGSIKRPMMGLRYIPITKEFAALNNMTVEKGALVTRGNNANELAVSPGGPADLAGIKENDILTSIGGKEINETNTIISILRNYKPGDTVKVKILRSGKTLEVSVKFGELKS
ncbi:trypsin-like peptidase domain-containing protein [Patescibacteria group bacterium]|nr:trypsin-like peptidase domain-containing protein [Patescibacteria group bacterium]